MFDDVAVQEWSLTVKELITELNGSREAANVTKVGANVHDAAPPMGSAPG